MKKTASLSLLAFSLIFLFTNLSSAQSKNPNGWDILGVRIDSTVKDATAALKAKIPNLVISERSGALRSGNFQSPRLLFGLVGNSPQRDEHKVYQDEITLVCDQVSPNKIISISRHSRFADDNMPSYDIVLKALAEKYGEPDIESEGQFYWFRNTSEKNKNSRKLEYISSYLPGIASSEMAVGIFGRKPGDIDKDCGTFVYYRIARSLSNRNLVNLIHCDLIDSVRLYNSYEYINKFMRDGAEGVAAKEKARGDQLKPKF
jgi:hypothetical protein